MPKMSAETQLDHIMRCERAMGIRTLRSAAVPMEIRLLDGPDDLAMVEAMRTAAHNILKLADEMAEDVMNASAALRRSQRARGIETPAPAPTAPTRRRAFEETVAKVKSRTRLPEPEEDEEFFGDDEDEPEEEPAPRRRESRAA